MQQKSSRGVQQHDVNEAADALLAESLRPTIERVRLKIGRGSPNTLAPMLEVWFAALGPRLGIGPAEDEGKGAPAAVRQAMEQVWSVALSAATAQAVDALAQDRVALAGERQDLAQARESLQAHSAAVAQREVLLQESLALARGQSEEASQRAASLQSKLEHAQADLAAGRQALADLVQQHAAERRAQSDQQRTQAADLKLVQERTASAERRLLEDVDRARQDAKQARRELADAQRAQEKEFKELGRANQALGARLQEAQIEVASLRERLAGAEDRASDMQGMLSAQRAAAGGPRSAPRRAAKKARGAVQK
jgi:chromosome segregation ATPase